MKQKIQRKQLITGQFNTFLALFFRQPTIQKRKLQWTYKLKNWYYGGTHIAWFQFPIIYYCNNQKSGVIFFILYKNSPCDINKIFLVTYSGLIGVLIYNDYTFNRVTIYRNMLTYTTIQYVTKFFTRPHKGKNLYIFFFSFSN